MAQRNRSYNSTHTKYVLDTERAVAETSSSQASIVGLCLCEYRESKIITYPYYIF